MEGAWKGQVKITILLATKEAEKLLRLVDSHSALEKEINSVEAPAPAAKCMSPLLVGPGSTSAGDALRAMAERRRAKGEGRTPNDERRTMNAESGAL